MKYIICGSNRPNSRSMDVCKIVQGLWKNLGETIEIIDVRDVGLDIATGAEYVYEQQPPKIKDNVTKILNSSGLIIVCPEYNGSVPGALKYFIDHWKYPDCFEFRPFCFIGLGGRWGGLRPVEHLQQIMGYRNSFIYPERVFLTDIWNVLKGGQIEDPRLLGLMTAQATGFQKFVKAIEGAGLDANTHLKNKALSPRS